MTNHCVTKYQEPQMSVAWILLFQLCQIHLPLSYQFGPGNSSNEATFQPLFRGSLAAPGFCSSCLLVNLNRHASKLNRYAVTVLAVNDWKQFRKNWNPGLSHVMGWASIPWNDCIIVSTLGTGGGGSYANRETNLCGRKFGNQRPLAFYPGCADRLFRASSVSLGATLPWRHGVERCLGPRGQNKRAMSETAPPSYRFELNFNLLLNVFWGSICSHEVTKKGVFSQFWHDLHDWMLWPVFFQRSCR